MYLMHVNSASFTLMLINPLQQITFISRLIGKPSVQLNLSVETNGIYTILLTNQSNLNSVKIKLKIIYLSKG